MNELPRITLITLVKNAANTIERTLQSISVQTYPNIEYIVLDAASTDGTVEIIRRYEKHITYFHSKPDKGSYDAAEQALKLVTGDIFGYVAGDDWLSANAAQIIVDLYKNAPTARIFSFGMLEYQQYESDRFYPIAYHNMPSQPHFSLKDSIFSHGSSFFYHKDLIKDQMFYKTDRYPKYADKELYVRLGLMNLPRAHTPEILYFFRRHASSVSSNGSRQSICNVLQEHSAIAEDLLSSTHILPEQRKQIQHWYCFVQLRHLYFMIRLGKYRQALQTTAFLLRNHLLLMVTGMTSLKAPSGYKFKIMRKLT